MLSHHKASLGAGLGIAAVLLLASVRPAGATDVTPVFIAGNPSCTDLGYAFGFKVDPPNAGTYSIDGINTVTVTTDDGIYFDWSSTLGMDAVIVKGGPNANVYAYSPERTSDTDQVSPINPNNGKPYALSHIEFCFDYEVAVSKTAVTSFTRTWQWRISKTASPDHWELFTGDTGTSLYTVGVERTGYTDSGWAVSGTIHIHNPSPMTATIASVSDLITGAIAPAVNCGVSFPYALGSNQSLDCTYQNALPDGSGRTNTASVTTTGSVGGGSGSAPVAFGDPTTQVNATVHVSDTNGGSWEFGDDGSVNYDRTFQCPGNVHGNTATIVETGQSASASVSVQCYDLGVTKDAHTALDRDWDWTIVKTADQQELTLAVGQQFLVNYQVVLSAASTDSGWSAHGTIHVQNPHPTRSALLLGVLDSVGVVNGIVNCSVAFPYTLPPGGDLSCSYTADLPSAATRTNTATATRQAFAYAPDGNGTPAGTTDASGTATVDFAGAAVSSYDECVDVTDSLQGALGTVCAADAPKTYNYSRFVGPFAAPAQCGDVNVDNTAAFVTNDTGARGDDTHTVLVHVVCNQGCTLTPGYWKTHSRRGPAPYDDTWALLGGAQENTAFFLSGKTYYQALWQAPQGNAYYILAHAWIATTLNGLNGASMPSEVQSAWNEALALFQVWTPAQVGAQKGSQQPRKRMLELAGLLDMYNNGLLGPGHCSE